ncbi:DUF5050 domain-containing protein [Clostridium sp. JNZ X4-2]
MKKTKLLVMTAAVMLGLSTAVYAKLPANSLIVGNNVYDMGYLNNSANLANINDQLMNNPGKIYYVGGDGDAKDIFSNSPEPEEKIVAYSGGVLTYYNASGVKKKIVKGADGKFADPTDVNTSMYAIVNVTYNQIATGFNIYTVKVSEMSGVKNAAYFKVGDSAVTPLTDTVTYIGNNLLGNGSILSIYDSDGITELANGYINFNQGTSTSGSFNSSVILAATSALDPTYDTVHGNTASNLANTGFAAVDEDGQWIYYENTADKNKLYRKSVTGTEDSVIGNDEVQYINVVEDWVYYSNYSDSGRIYKIRTDGTQRQKVSDDEMASCLNVVGDKIYFINGSDRGRIYVHDSQGSRQLLSDTAECLGVGDNFLFYINASDGNKLYSYNLMNNSKTRLSDVDTEFISVAGDYRIFYTGKDGKLYTSMGTYTKNPTPLSIITNVPQKGKGNTNLNGQIDKATVILGLDYDNIYYISYVDKGKIYKLDSTGNGYKVVDDSASYMNIAGDTLYYMKSEKAYVISRDSDGTAKGTAVTKPPLSEKVKYVYELPTYSTDDIAKFSFPERVSAMMSDGTIRQLVVNWDKDNPKIQKGVYNFSGTVLGYGTKVTMSVALDSGTVNANNITAVNNIGKNDSVTVNGANTNLKPGDVISLYGSMSDTKPMKTAAVNSSYKAVLSGLDLDPEGTVLYVTVTSKDRAEGSKVAVYCPAEAPSGFYVDAQNQQINGLKPGKKYKIYINDENPDGTTPALPEDYVEAAADEKGSITVSNMQSKILGSSDKKQMLRLVIEGNVDSKPSQPIEISKAAVPDSVYIDLVYGRIVGSTPGMQYRYNTDDWKDCQGGSTSISTTLSLQVQLKVKADGPVMESDVATYGLFPVPEITGIENGKIYSTGEYADGKSTFPEVSWNSDTDNIKYTALLAKKDGAVVDDKVTPSTLLGDLKSQGDGDYVLKVTGTKTDPKMNPSSVSNSKTVNFTVNSAAPSKVDISFAEKPGSDGITYYEATPQWMDLGGTYSSVQLIRTKEAEGTAGNVIYTDIPNPATVAFVPGNTITQDGEYKLIVTTTSRENGAVSTAEKTFRVDPIDRAVSPDVTVVSSGGIYTSAVTPVITDKENCTTKAAIMLNGNSIPYTSGSTLTVNGQYVLVLDTTNNINGSTKETKIPFTIDDANNNMSQEIDSSDVTVNNNPSGDDTLEVSNIPYESKVNVYNMAGNLIGTATNKGSTGSVNVTVTGGISAGDTGVYVTRTDSGKQESNKVKIPVTLVPNIKSISPTIFTETPDNDGSISGIGTDGLATQMITLEIQNGTINEGIRNSDVNAENLPAGLDYTVEKLDDTHVGIKITGKASANSKSDSISNLTFTINSSGMSAVTGGTVKDVVTTPITINFSD